MNNLRNKAYTLLRKSERWFKTDMVYLAKGGFWLTLGHIVAVSAGLGLSIGFANLLPKESFGTYKFILSVAGILGAFSLTGLPTVIAKTASQGFNGFLKSGFWLNLKWSFLVFIGGLIGGVYYYLNGNDTLAISMLLIGSFSPLIGSASIYSSFLEGKRDFKRQVRYAMVRNVLPPLTLLATIFFTDSALIIILVYFLTNTLTALFFYFLTLAAYQPISQKDPEAVSYSKHLSLMNVIGLVSGQIDKVLIFHFLGPISLAVYSFAVAPVDQLQAGKKFIKTLAFPKLANQSIADLHRSVPQKAKIFLAISIAMCLVYIALIPYFYKFVLPQYIDSILYSQVYSLILFSSPAMLYLESLVAHEKKKELYWIRTLSPIIKIALYIVLLPLFGLMGLIIALVIAKIISALMTVFFFKRASSSLVES